MKKIYLVLLPMAAMVLVGCRGGRGRGSTSAAPSGTSAAPSGQTTNPGPSPTTGGGTTTGAPQPTTTTGGGGSAAQFDLTPGSHSVTINFATDYESYKSDFPYVTADMGIYDCTFAGLSIKGRNTFVSSYSGDGYLFLKNKDMDGNAAFIANQVSLGNISKISFTSRAGSAADATYNILITNSAQSNSSSEGVTKTGVGTFDVTGSGGYFCISQNNLAKNGQFSSLTVEYTIS